MYDDFRLAALEAAAAAYGRMAPLIFSTRAKAASSPALHLSTCSSARRSRPAWMEAVAGWITCSSSGYSEAWNTRRSISKAYEDRRQVQHGLGTYFAFYNSRR